MARINSQRWHAATQHALVAAVCSSSSSCPASHLLFLLAGPLSDVPVALCMHTSNLFWSCAAACPAACPRSLMRSIYQVEVALVSLVEAEELTFPAKAGEWPDKIPRVGSFCDWIFVAPTASCLIFEDLTQDIRWRRGGCACAALHFEKGGTNAA